MELETILENLVRIGKVMSVDAENRLARVKFLDTEVISDWLYVLAARPYVPDYDGSQRTEFEEGGGGAAAYARHKHNLEIKPWLPEIDAGVLCLYIPVFNADGFILGEIGALGTLKQMKQEGG